ncbi:MAG: 16S rRNA (cytosine(967)-C(5))-methyltransferase RsmB [Ignavibacteria bacterium]|jgi:16S rRNA (cytosine967-C5)-methyltransferase
MSEIKEYSGLNLYKGVRGIAVKLLNRIDRTDAYLDKMLEIELKNSNLNRADKALLFEIVHGVIRWLGRIDWILIGFYKGQFSKCIPNVKNAMRVALYQVLFLDKIPEFAAVNEAVEFVKKLQGEKSANLTNAVLRNIIRNKEGIRYPNKEEDNIGFLSAYYSHPTWLVKRWAKRFGEEFTEDLLIANNQKPVLSLRINKLKTNKEEFVKLLKKVKLKFTYSKYHDEFVRLSNLTNIQDWEYFTKGYFTIQDESTGFSCKLLDVKPGMKVLDLCAAPGGKTAMLADLMNNEGEIVALDKYESRLKILKKNLDRLGVTIVKTVEVDAMDYAPEEGLFDRILVDAPCSGLGTLTKKPDIKWKRDMGELRKLADLQYQLLNKASTLLKKGGIVVYSTCTIEPDENSEVVERFLNDNSDFKLISAEGIFNESLLDENKCVQSLPNIHKIDGSFAAKLIKE